MATWIWPYNNENAREVKSPPQLVRTKWHDLFIYEKQHVGSRKSPLPFRLIQRAMKLIVRLGVNELVLGMSHGSHDSESYNRGIRNCSIYEVKTYRKKCGNGNEKWKALPTPVSTNSSMKVFTEHSKFFPGFSARQCISSMQTRQALCQLKEKWKCPDRSFHIVVRR